jgi:DNA-binding XRE family transcriptional regulator
MLKYEYNNQNNRRTNMIFADKLILLRKKAGWSQEELADQMNVTRQSVSK